jgi:hypothetical protein
MVPCYDEEGDKFKKRRRATHFHATKPGRDCPTKPRVAQVFKDEDEMDNHMSSLKKRKRAQDEVCRQISVSKCFQLLKQWRRQKNICSPAWRAGV